MLLKVVLVTNMLAVIVMTLGPSGIQNNTSIAKLSKQLVEWYREMITQLADN